MFLCDIPYHGMLWRWRHTLRNCSHDSNSQSPLSYWVVSNHDCLVYNHVDRSLITSMRVRMRVIHAGLVVGVFLNLLFDEILSTSMIDGMSPL